jgi:hypothetical protein
MSGAEEVPAELAEIGREALYKHMAASLPPVLMFPTYEERARAVLAAVLPLHEKQVREQVAKEITAERDEVASSEGATITDDRALTARCGGLAHAARIARGES